ncbi:hypothetical protein ACPV5U_19520 [Vibrio mediterranei]
MAELSKVISSIIDIETRITIKNLSASEIEELAPLVPWRNNHSGAELMTFGGSYFKPFSRERAVVIDTGSVFFDYELKAILIAALHLGTVEGGTPYKWKTALNRVRTLKTFSQFLQARNLSSFRELNDIPELKLRTILRDFLYKPKNEGGMDLKCYTSAAKTVREGIKFLFIYELVSPHLLSRLIDELTLVKITKHEDEHRLKHSIIPTNIMKAIIATSNDYIQKVKANINVFIHAHKQANQRIYKARTAEPSQVLHVTCHNIDKELSEGYELVRGLSLHTYTLILAFTGMRDNEVYALKNHCHAHRVETGETVYIIKSELSKTTDGLLELDWIANELVYDAVALLSKVNDVYQERARLLLTHHKHNMPKKHIDRYEKGLKNNRLFGLRHTKATARFIEAARGSDADVSISLGRHRFQVTAADIEQLEKMGCNYQSINQQSGKRGVKYKVGDFFNFTAHQFRHTFAWFIIANRLGDLDDIKYQFKHLNNVMTFVYSERGYEALSELRTVIEYFEEFVNKQALEDIVDSAKQNKVAGGGGNRLALFIAKLNANQSQTVFSTQQQSHFNNTRELIDFATKHSDSIRGLPHGYCTKGASCKIKNASDPSHCLYCDTYYATPKHLPYWKAIQHHCIQKIERIKMLPDPGRYQAFLTGLEDNLSAANQILDKLEPTIKLKADQ